MTPELKRFVDALRSQFPQYFSSGEIYHLGVTNCRRKNNNPGSAWSEHSWSNAVDIMLRTIDGVPGDQIAAWARSRPDLASEVFWKIALHHNHVHVTANPRRNYDNKQVPPCAGGEDDMAILTDQEQKELQAFLSYIKSEGSNVSFVVQAIQDVRERNTNGPWAPANHTHPSTPLVDSTARSLAQRALDTLAKIRTAVS
jgi:hypothetical protein